MGPSKSKLNIWIRTDLLHLGRKMVDLHISLSNLFFPGFMRKKYLFNQVKDNFEDFSRSKMTFTQIPTEIHL